MDYMPALSHKYIISIRGFLTFGFFLILLSSVYAQDDLGQPTKESAGKPISTGPVQIINGALFVKNNSFFIRGAGYQPIPIGKSAAYGNGINDVFNFAYKRDLPVLRAMNANRVRTWAIVTNH